MPADTLAFSPEGVHELNGYRLYAKMNNVLADRAKSMWDRLPEETREFWRGKAAERLQRAVPA